MSQPVAINEFALDETPRELIAAADMGPVEPPAPTQVALLPQIPTITAPLPAAQPKFADPISSTDLLAALPAAKIGPVATRLAVVTVRRASSDLRPTASHGDFGQTFSDLAPVASDLAPEASLPEPTFGQIPVPIPETSDAQLADSGELAPIEPSAITAPEQSLGEIASVAATQG
jgi:hypothetical protein